MALTKVELTAETFIGGVLRPAGYVVEIDLADLGVKKLGEAPATPPGVDAQAIAAALNKAAPAPNAGAAAGIDLTANLVKAKDHGDPIPYEVASIAPTGPNPTAPQAVPPGTLQSGDAWVAQTGGDGKSLAAQVIPEKPAEPEPVKRGPGRPRSND